MSRETKLAAADICDRAHDILLETGVQCAETYNETGRVYDPMARQGHCLWQAIAVAMGGSYHEWGNVMERATNGIGPVYAELGRLPGYNWNDFEARVDDVFDVLRSTAKTLREEAGDE